MAPIYSTSDMYDTSIYRPIGIVTVTAVWSQSKVRDFFSGISGVFGGPNDILNKIIEHPGKLLDILRTKFVNKMYEKFPRDYIEQVVGITIDIIPNGGDAGGGLNLFGKISGTCLVAIQSGGKDSKRRTRRAKKRSNRRKQKV